MLSYQLSVSNKISRLLNKYNIKTVHIAARKSMHLLGPAKDNLGQMVAGIYCIPSECGRVYVRQTPAEPSSPGARDT
jgi:NAD(P)H-nitrite reductase large subunit